MILKLNSLITIIQTFDMYVRIVLFKIILFIFRIKVSSSDLQRFIFGEQYAIIEQDQSIEPTPSKRLKSSNTIEGDEEVRAIFFRIII
jgi:hypothetical protein